MKKAILFLCMAAGLLSCTSEIFEPEKENEENTPITLKVRIPETKAVKTDWANGDKIFVFFNGLSTKYLVMTYNGGTWGYMVMADNGGLWVEGGSLYKADFNGIDGENMKLTAVHFPVAVDVTYTNNKYVFTSGGERVYTYYLHDSGEKYTVDGTTLSATLTIKKPKDMAQFHVAGIQANVSDYTFGCQRVMPVACTSVGSDGTLAESVLQAGAPLSGLADSDGAIFAGRLTKPGKATDYVFTVTNGSTIYTLTRKGKTLTAGEMYNFPALSETGGSNWAVDAPYVDLGIKVKGKKIYWAKCNLGAGTETDYGDFFAWGDTKPNYTQLSPLTWDTGKTGFNWASYSLGNHAESTFSVKFTKYTVKKKYSTTGTADNKTVLDAEDDAAHVMLGENWRMPTKDEWDALLATKNNKKYTWTWYSGGNNDSYYYHGASGWLIRYSVNSATLFLPVTGNYDVSGRIGTTGGYYWSSSLKEKNEYNAFNVVLGKSRNVVDDDSRFKGMAIRPVWVEE